MGIPFQVWHQQQQCVVCEGRTSLATSSSVCLWRTSYRMPAGSATPDAQLGAPPPRPGERSRSEPEPRRLDVPAALEALPRRPSALAPPRLAGALVARLVLLPCVLASSSPLPPPSPLLPSAREPALLRPLSLIHI